ncbi:hypothetical protein NGRA_1662 [Nosema granulosis]|uniref:Uncharacterized protein n=1 Tax=Nosema granulosis TaxID=83296 RepID=A0A9P6KYE6_9MICR|nr:hypothetical protein NGRA_1662 [Nosema granulosis]
MKISNSVILIALLFLFIVGCYYTLKTKKNSSTKDVNKNKENTKEMPFENLFKKENLQKKDDENVPHNINLDKKEVEKNEDINEKTTKETFDSQENLQKKDDENVTNVSQNIDKEVQEEQSIKKTEKKIKEKKNNPVTKSANINNPLSKSQINEQNLSKSEKNTDKNKKPCNIQTKVLKSLESSKENEVKKNTQKKLIIFDPKLVDTSKFSNRDFISMFLKVCGDKNIRVYSNNVIEKCNYLFCFRKFYQEAVFCKLKKNEESIFNYLSNAPTDKTEDYDDEDYFYFLNKRSQALFYIKDMIVKGNNIMGSYLYTNMMDIVSEFPKRKIIAGASSFEHVIGQYYLSLIYFTLERMMVYVQKNSLKVGFIYSQIKNTLMGNKDKLRNQRALKMSQQFFKYAFKELSLPEIRKNDKYDEFKNFVIQDENLRALNDISISFEGYINDVPFSIVEHVFNCFYVVVFN